MGENPGPIELRSRLGQSELGESFVAARNGEVCGVFKRFTAEQTADPSFRAALLAELTLATQLKHPAIAAVLEQGELDGRAYVLVEYIEGTSLAQLIRAAQAEKGWPLSMARAVSLLTPVLEALSTAHRLQPPLLHRDLAPENVVVSPTGRVVLTDFGLGRARQRVGGAAGLRRAYVSPEQARGLACDARSEVFAAGLLLFELVCGRLPAVGGPGEVISRIATGELDAPRLVNPALDEAAAAVLTRALAARPEERFASARDFAAALGSLAGADAEPLPAWVTRLQQVKLEPLPLRVIGPVKPTVKPLVSPAPAAVVPAAVPRSKRRIWVAAAVALGLVSFVDWSRLLATEVAVADGRPLELTSIPSSATVLVDMVVVGRTPVTLRFAKNEMHHLAVRKPGFGSWDGVIRNTSKLRIDLASSQHEEERYDGERALPPPPAPEGVIAPIESSTPSPPVVIEPETETVFDVEMPPVQQLLTRRHSVGVDDAPSLEIPDGAEVTQEGHAMLYQLPSLGNLSRNQRAIKDMRLFNSPAAQPTWRAATVFGVRRTDTGIEAYDFSQRVHFNQGGPVHVFSPTEGPSDQLKVSCTVLVNQSRRQLLQGVVLRVHQDDSFLVRALKPEVTYRLSLALADDSNKPIPPIIISLKPAIRRPTITSEVLDNHLRVDGQPLDSEQALLPAGVHSITGASSVLFILPTLEGIVPPDVKMSLKPVLGATRKALETQLRKLQVEVHRAGEKPAVDPYR